MDQQQVLQLLASTLESASTKAAASQLEQLVKNPDFPIALLSIAADPQIPVAIRQAALLQLKQVIGKTWSSNLEEYEADCPLSDTNKLHLRQSLLTLATNDGERRITSFASYCVASIASADFPDQWPDLLTNLLDLVPRSNEQQLHAVLIVLGNLVEDGFDEDQFSTSAVQLVNCLRDVTADPHKKLTSRALAVSSFRACFDTLELVYENNQQAVKQFMQDAADAWLPLFIDILRTPLPHMPTTDEELEGHPSVTAWRGVVALKTQVVKVGLFS